MVLKLFELKTLSPLFYFIFFKKGSNFSKYKNKFKKQFDKENIY